MKNFILIGVGGYIAPKHLRAIKETGHQLIAAMDVHDAVGILDSYFPNARFFKSLSQLKYFIDKEKSSGTEIHYLVICSPNHFHEEHILFGLKAGLDVICEKPVALNNESLNKIQKAEQQSGKKVSTIMQLRWHPAVRSVKKNIEQNSITTKYNVEVKYITARGRWYHNSWKGDDKKSGGIATNIGIHLFDLLIWFFGDVIEQQIECSSKEKISGKLVFRNATVNWLLCIDENELPDNIKKQGKRVYRSFLINGEEIDFSEGAMDLHTESYREILSGNGFGLAVTKPSVQIVESIRAQPVLQ